ncbi:MAG: DUF2119 domain-containing protein [Methanophagales archaeon]|nr:DUF2119 domain-containing protein [Methanophagales archaeon]
MKLYRFPGSGGSGGASKLFVGGLHGNEGLYTAPILETLASEAEAELESEVEVDSNDNNGDVIIVPSLTMSGRYIGVLSKEYYRSREGMILTGLIKRYKPSFYFELHAYGESSYPRLTNPEREKIEGVPPFVDLDDPTHNHILLGSIAPVLRKLFSTRDFCLTIELPKRRSDEDVVREEVLVILRIGLRSETRAEMLTQLRKMYPDALRRAEALFMQYYHSRLEPFEPF